jgi:hypothetical protein
MRRLALTIAGFMALLSGNAAAAGDTSGHGGRDSAVGGGTNEFAVVIGDARFGFAATSDPIGLGPAGHAASHGDPDGIGPMGAFTAEGAVTCLRVDGNRASFRWRFAQTTGSAAPFQGGGVQVFVQDNGEPRGGVPVDWAFLDAPQPAGVFELGAGNCTDPNLVGGDYARLESGNVTVQDAVP